MKKHILNISRGCFLLIVFLTVGCSGKTYQATLMEKEVPMAHESETEELIIITDENIVLEEQPIDTPIIHSLGTTLEQRFRTPEGYGRVSSLMDSFQDFLRKYPIKPDKNPVLLYDGTEKSNQSAHAAVLDMPLITGDLQQCADSIMRIYGEYLWTIEAYDTISFHLTSGFLMDYNSWREGNRLAVSGNKVAWVKKSSYDPSYETFLLYLKNVMVYAGTLSLDKESSSIELSDIQAGDMFIKGGSPGHCVMVADVAMDQEGNKCFLLAQGYMPAQDFHILKNPLHEDDPWYYDSEITYPFATPEYVFQEGSLKRWYGFVSE